MAHPDIEQRFAICTQGIFDTANQCAVCFNFDLCVTKFTFVRTLNVAAKLHRHGLHAVAHAKYWHTCGEDIFRRTWAIVFSSTFRATRKDDTAWVEITNLCFSDIPCPQLTVNAQFTHTARYKLSVLRTEIKDKYAMFMDIFRH
ncbi:hypothetical protein D3C75_810750 [compost metagenome]